MLIDTLNERSAALQILEKYIEMLEGAAGVLQRTCVLVFFTTCARENASGGFMLSSCERTPCKARVPIRVGDLWGFEQFLGVGTCSRACPEKNPAD